MNQRTLFIILGTIVSIFLLISSGLVTQSPMLKPAEAQGLTREMRNWEFQNHNRYGTNHNPQTVINKDNVQHLELKWIYPLPDSSDASTLGWESALGRVERSEGSETPPLIVDGFAYVMTGYRTIFAIDAATGQQVWIYNHEFPEEQDLSAAQGDLPVRPWSLHVHGINYFEGRIWFYAPGCKVVGVDALTGEKTYELGPTCANVPGNKNDPADNHPAGEGLYRDPCSTHIPQYNPDARQIIVNCAGASEGTWGGRPFVAAYNIDTKQLLWRNFYGPPRYPAEPGWSEELCRNSIGWMAGAEFTQRASGSLAGWGDEGPFERATKNEYSYKYWSCDEVMEKCPECLANDWIPGMSNNYKTGAVWDGRFAGGSGISNAWGHMPIDPETGLLFFGTAQPGPDWNETFRPGPNLCTNCVVAVDTATGDTKWWMQTWAHDGIDVDCNMNTLWGKVGDQRVVMKTCKSGISVGLDADTGEPLWMWDPFSVPTEPLKRPEEFDCSAPANPMDLALLTCLNQWCDGVLGSYENRKANCVNVGLHNRYMSESDQAFDGTNYITSVMSGPSYVFAANTLRGDPPGGTGSGVGVRNVINWPDMGETSNIRNNTVYSINAVTGEINWSWYRAESHRGGIIVSGDVVYQNDHMGYLNLVDATNGQLIERKHVGQPLTSQPTMGADLNGDMKVFTVFGGAKHGVHGERGVGNIAGPGGGANVPGAIVAWGLPDELPVTQEELQAAEDRADQAEMRAQQAEAEAGAISPISYVAIGVSVVLVVVAGILFSRKRNA